jgi:hypothetical protein
MKLIIQAPNESNCACGSWLDHWKKFSGQPAPVLCPGFMCVDKIEVGVPVQKEGGTDKNAYIALVCKRHSSQIGESITANDYFPLVSTNISETCGKPQS